MKAVRVVEWGKPVRIEQLAQPSPAADEVLLNVRAASVNPVDGGIAAGYMQSYFSAPLTLGSDFAGDVIATGANVKHVKPGDTVYGFSLSRGTFAECAAVNQSGVARMPESLDYVHAAAVPLAGLTAWQMIYNLARVKRGERVLIHGAGGGVGSFAVQLAKDAGAYVIGHARANKADFVRRLGADQFVDSGSQRFEDAVGTVDVVLDLVGGEFVDRSFAVLKAGGRFVTAAAMLPEGAGKELGIFATGTFTQPTIEELNDLARAIDTGAVKVYVSRTFPLAETQTAIGYKVPDHAPGKVVITVGS